MSQTKNAKKHCSRLAQKINHENRRRGLHRLQRQAIMKKDRITREKEMLPEMVKIYCHGVNKTKKSELCIECQELTDYALFRLDHCRWGNEKNFCSQCPCHCYKPGMKEKIRAVMRLQRTENYALSSAYRLNPRL